MTVQIDIMYFALGGTILAAYFNTEHAFKCLGWMILI